MENKYQKGKIYKIVCKTTNKVYIGSTCEKYLSDRLKGHRIAYKYKKDTTNYYCSVFEVLKNNDYYIELIENYPCTCKDELSRRERHHINITENCINIKRPIVEPGEKKEEFEKTIEKIKCPKCSKEVQRRSLNSHYKSRVCTLINSLNCDRIKFEDVITIDKIHPPKNDKNLFEDSSVEVVRGSPHSLSDDEIDEDDKPPQGLLHFII